MMPDRIKTMAAVQKFEMISGAYADYLLLCEKDGWIELLDLSEKKITYSYQHSCRLSIQDVIKVSLKNAEYNEFALAFA
jgi:hypothetical protein